MAHKGNGPTQNRHTQEPVQSENRVGPYQITHYHEFKDGRKIAFGVNGYPCAVNLAFHQQRTDLLDANLAHRHSIELGRQILPDTGLFRAVATEYEDRLDLSQICFRRLGKRAFSSALAFLQRLQVALLDLLPLMGRWMPCLTKALAFSRAKRASSRLTWGKLLIAKRFSFALQAALPPPELVARGLDQQE